MAKLSGANIAGLIWNQFLVHKQSGVDVKHVEVSVMKILHVVHAS